VILAGLAFYGFAFIAIASGVMVISARNPVHSVLFLILAFFNAAGLFILMGAEFIGFILVIVYVGAVAVLFIFVVMMLDINFVEMRQGFLQYLPVGGLIGTVLLVELIFVVTSWAVSPESGSLLAAKTPCAGKTWSRSRTCRRGRGSSMFEITLGHYLAVAAILFTLGVFGIFLNRKNVIIILMSIELMLLAVNINLVAFSTHLGDLTGQIFAMFVLTVAAAEAAIGLAILVVYFRNRGSIAVEDINRLKG
jgi:NADH:ubiquinone oxidoreductase subunit K/NADH:ubiquinone oxidoreductase subunit 6 (subunit J)